MAQTPQASSHWQKFVQDQLTDSAETKQRMIASCSADILMAAEAILTAYRNRKKLLICGNGGSAADAQHIATELVIRMSIPDRPSLPAIALTTDSSMLTAGGNDIGFENIFARQVEGLGNQGDVLLAISTSGKSENVNRAIAEAKKKGMTVVAFLGKDGGPSKAIADIPIIVPSSDTQRIQEGHITIAHILCGIVEQELFG
jgi:D-sedoheptulose 7-phosphate isomerase